MNEKNMITRKINFNMLLFAIKIKVMLTFQQKSD